MSLSRIWEGVFFWSGTYEWLVLCRHPPDSGECTYGAPSVSAWAAVAVAVSSPKLRTSLTFHLTKLHLKFNSPFSPAIPASSGYTAIALSIFAALSVAVKVSFSCVFPP